MSEEKVGRRGALGMIAGILGAVWAAAAAGLSGIFIGSSVFGARKQPSAAVSTFDRLDTTFQEFTIEQSIRDSWYSQTATRTVYARLSPNAPDEPQVLSATCTHLGCTVRWNAEADEFQCPCHGGRFDADGRRIAGPPPSDLEQLQARIDGADVVVDFG